MLVCHVKHELETSILYENIEIKLVVVYKSDFTRIWSVLWFLGIWPKIKIKFIEIIILNPNYIQEVRRKTILFESRV